ncbi:MAG: putative N-acetylmannosamine-6-phosphate 2-epimerase, partial [Hyphomicrobiales bacterium]|nr:putative N-acetylmannosamine-6-phosphate 2-epimerase [Hyphomicrobiales bacterium]
RIEGATRVANVRSALPDVPIVGIVKRDLEDSDVRITPLPQDVDSLIDADADIVGIDGTHRPRPHAFADLASVAHRARRLVMADISSADEAVAALQCGVAIVGTTLSGYTGESTPEEPDFDLLEALRDHDCLLVAEGRFQTPELCRQAIHCGADCVTVGSALTRLELATARFVGAISAAGQNGR